MNIDQTLHAAVEAMGAGAFAQAEARCRSVLRAFPDHFFATLILADVLTQAGRSDAALPLYEKAAAINPGHASAFSRIAMTKFRKAFGKPRNARATPNGARRIQLTALGS